MSKVTIGYRGKETVVMPGHHAVLDCYKKTLHGQVVIKVDPLEDGGIIPDGTKEITEDGEHNVAGYAVAKVNVQPPLQEKTTTPGESAVTVAADDDYYGLSSVTVDAIQTEEKTATQNGTVEASEGKFLKKVHVDVPITEEPNGTVHITENGTHNIKNYAEANVDVKPPLQEKSVTPTTEAQEITANEDFYGMKKVTVEAIETERASVTANGTYTPTPGKFFAGFSVNVPIPDGYVKPVGDFPMTENGIYDVTRYESVTVNVQPPLQEKSVTPTASAQEVVADASNYGMSKVTVEAVPTEEVTITDPVTTVEAPEGKFIRKVNVNVPTVTVYSGTTEPTNDIGNDGDIYLLLEE